jgi:hypothetical protein
MTVTLVISPTHFRMVVATTYSCVSLLVLISLEQLCRMYSLTRHTWTVTVVPYDILWQSARTFDVYWSDESRDDARHGIQSHSRASLREGSASSPTVMRFERLQTTKSALTLECSYYPNKVVNNKLHGLGNVGMHHPERVAPKKVFDISQECTKKVKYPSK